MPSDNLTYYKIIFFLEIIIAEMLFAFRLEKRKSFFLRFAFATLISFVICFFFPIFGIHHWLWHSLYSSLMFMLLFFLSIGLLFFCFKENLTSILFVGISGYLTQHMAYQLYNSVMNLSGQAVAGLGLYGSVEPMSDAQIFASSLTYFICYLVVYGIVFFTFANRIQKGSHIVIKNRYLFFTSAIILVVVILLNSFIIYKSYDFTGETYRDVSTILGLTALISLACTIVSISVEFLSYEANVLDQELSMMNEILKQERKQYIESKETIDLINLKCHDLKHQIRTLTSNQKLPDETINEITNIISIYDSTIQTGNKVLDTILTKKSLECNQKSIQITSVIDGKQLSFINEVDLYTLFGNILDNAIQAVENLPKEMRVISVTSCKNSSLFSLVIRNYFQGEIHFKDGLPETNKHNKDFHGFGMKSIKRIVEYYGGDIQIFTEDNVFNLGLLFNVDKNQESKN